MHNFFSGSWKPKLAAIAALLVSVGNVLMSLLDGDPSTNPDWDAFITTIMAVALAFGLWSARQDDKRSEDVGAGTHPTQKDRW